jgi:type I restriction enzyme, R subunit
MTQTEAQTRKELIDKQLQLAGWDVNDCTQVTLEFDIKVDLPEGVKEARTQYEGHQFCDYVLLGKNGKPLAVVEAKKTSKDAAVGREQAKQYCYNSIWRISYTTRNEWNLVRSTKPSVLVVIAKWLRQ